MAALGARVDDAPVAELELDAGDLDAARARRDREADAALGGVLERAGEDLARRHVAPAVGVDPRAAGDAQPQVRALGLDAQLARARQPLDQPRLALRRSSRQAAAGSSRSRNVARRTNAANSAVPIRACCARGRRRPERPAPAPPQRGLADRRAGAGGAGHPRRVDAGERGRVLRRLDRERRVGLLRLGQLGGRERVEVGVARRAHQPSSCRAATVRSSGHAPRARAARAGRRAAAAPPASSSARPPAGPAARPGSSRTAAARSAAASITAPRAPGSARRGARAARRGSSARSSGDAKRKRPSSSFWLVIGSVPAISQRTARRSNRNSTARCQASSRDSGDPPPTAAYSRRVAGVIAPRSTSTSPAASGTRTPARRQRVAAPRRRLRLPISRRVALELRRHVAA